MKLYILLSVLFFSHCASAQVNNVTAFFEGSYDKKLIVKHQIKQVITDIKVSGRTESPAVYNFDTMGRLQKLTAYDTIGNKQGEWLFLHNDRGDYVEIKQIDYDAKQTYTSTFTRSYQGSQIIREEWTLLPQTVKYHYYVDSQKTQSITVLGDDSLYAIKQIVSYRYDEQGKMISKKMVVTGRSNVLSAPEITVYEYDATGKLITVKRDNAATYEYTYNEAGLLKTEWIKMPKDQGGIDIYHNYAYSFWTK